MKAEQKVPPFLCSLFLFSLSGNGNFNVVIITGLLFNHLSVNEKCVIILDSRDQSAEDCEEEESVVDVGCDVASLRELLGSSTLNDLDSLEICPTFTSFSFGSADSSVPSIDFQLDEVLCTVFLSLSLSLCLCVCVCVCVCRERRERKRSYVRH